MGDETVGDEAAETRIRLPRGALWSSVYLSSGSHKSQRERERGLAQNATAADDACVGRLGRGMGSRPGLAHDGPAQQGRNREHKGRQRANAGTAANHKSLDAGLSGKNGTVGGDGAPIGDGRNCGRQGLQTSSSCASTGGPDKIQNAKLAYIAWDGTHGSRRAGEARARARATRA